MEFKIRAPGGIELEYRREPMSKERFELICLLIGIYIVGSGVIKFFSLVIRA